MTLKGIVITVNYPEDEVQANVPSEMTPQQLFEAIGKLIVEEKDMTSFVVVAAIDHNQ